MASRWSRWWAAGMPLRVEGVVAPEGVCAYRRAGDACWTARVRLAPWSKPQCAPTDEPLEVEWQASTQDLVELQRRWRPGSQARALVRIRNGTLQARLLRPL